VKRDHSASDLRYLEAGSVSCPAGNLSEFRVCSEDAQPLGNVAGVLISPSQRQLRYFVVETMGLFTPRRYLLSAETGAVLQPDRKVLQIGARKDQIDLQSFKRNSVQEYSEDDALTAMFAA